MSPPRDTLVFVRGDPEPWTLFLGADSGDSINAAVVDSSGEVRAEKWFWGWGAEEMLRDMLANLPPEIVVVGLVRAGWLFDSPGFDANGSPIEEPAWPEIEALRCL